ncbi:MAG: ABC transporter ATP-binding protein/permease [Clostridiales bacterium]|nr:ABC transporter ATP-binding protein/permease [Clostridiales bacterium]
MKKSQSQKNQFQKKDMLLLFLRGAAGYFVGAIIFACLSALADMVRPKIIEYTVDGILGNSTDSIPAFVLSWFADSGGIVWLKSHLWVPALAVIVTTLIAVVLRYIYEMCVVKGSESFVCNMRDHLFSHLERLSVEWHSSHQTGDILQRCTTDVEEVKTFLSEHFVKLFSMIMTILLALVFMFRIQWQLTLIALASIPVIVGISLWFHNGIGRGFKECDENEGVLSTIAQENLSGVRVVRAFGKERSEREKFRIQNQVVTDRWVDLGRFMTIFFFFIDFLSGLVMMLILAVGTVMCVRSNLTVGALLAMISYVTMLLRPVRMLGRILSEMSKTGVSFQRLYEIMCAPTEEDAPESTEAPMNRDIIFDHVSFSYPGQPELLSDISFTIPAGTTLGILGTTGSGKSTLIQLLTKFYPLPPQNGKITVGGTDLQEIPAAWVRKNIGYVMQEPFLFSRSIAENITITQEKADESQVEKAADMAALSDTIESFPKGYDTFVGERGMTLSGGQKQRTAIARALTLQAPILVFDDSLSAVDAETDARIRSNLKEYMGNATVILVSHRTTTLMAADQIIVLKEGKLVDSGTHEELISRPGLYREIYDIQSGREADES